MALTVGQISDILFKKVFGRKASTKYGAFFANNEEPFSGAPFVDLEQIWIDSDLIPDTVVGTYNDGDEVVVGVVRKFKKQMLNVAGTSAFYHPDLSRVIPFNYGDGTSYVYTVYEADGTTIIPLGVNDWILDPETGVLTFFQNDTDAPTDEGDLPSGISTSSGPYLECYQYIGVTAKDTGLQPKAAGGSNIGEWQDSVIGVIRNDIGSPADTDPFTINTGFASPSPLSYYDNLNFTGTEYTKSDIVDGDRFLYLGDDIIGSPNIVQINPRTYEPEITPELLNGSIIEWFSFANRDVGSQDGWLVLPPSTGMFTTIDVASNKSIVRYTGSEWVSHEFEKTYSANANLAIRDIADVGGWQVVGFEDVTDTSIRLSDASLPQVEAFLNGVRLEDSIQNPTSPEFGWGKLIVDATFNSGNFKTVSGDTTTFEIPSSDPDSSLIDVGDIVNLGDVGSPSANETIANVVAKELSGSDYVYTVVRNAIPDYEIHFSIGSVRKMLISGVVESTYPLDNSYFPLFNSTNAGYDISTDDEDSLTLQYYKFSQ